MKAIILAAGMGSRLDDSPDHLPKALTAIDHTTILGQQIKTLSYYLSMDDIWVIVGYRKEAIMDAYPDLGYVFNSNFQNENTAKSLLRALKKIDDDVLWLNGDVVFKPAILEVLFKEKKTGMVVNQAVVGEEEVKYRTDNQGQILEVSKEVSEPEGEALGINLFQREHLPMLRRHLEKCQPHDYFEKGIQFCIQEGLPVRSYPIPKDDCIEIDFHEDLVRAKQLVSQWQLR